MIKKRFLIRVGTKRDLPFLIQCESHFKPAITKRRLRQFVCGNANSIIVEIDKELVGSCLYTICPRCIIIFRIFVVAQHRRQGLGSAMMDRVKWELSEAIDPNTIIAEAHERDLATQLFLKDMGLRWCMSIDSVYRFKFVKGKEVWPCCYKRACSLQSS